MVASGMRNVIFLFVGSGGGGGGGGDHRGENVVKIEGG